MHRATSAIARHPTKEIREQHEQMASMKGRVLCWISWWGM